MIYCVVPEALADELYDKLVDYYKDDPNVEVIIERRGARGAGVAGASPCADSRIQPSWSALPMHSSQTSLRCPPGARYASVLSPFRMVRPQTAHETAS